MSLLFLGFAASYRCKACGEHDGLRGPVRGPWLCRTCAGPEEPAWLAPLAVAVTWAAFAALLWWRTAP